MPGAAAAAARIADEAFGGIDVLVNNAGYGLIGAVEEATPEEYRPMFETNLFGMIETTRAVLPYLRRKPGSRIVNISSGAGIIGRRGFGLYNGTKFALEGVSEALADELQPFGIAVIIVEPGPFRTAFLGRSLAMAKNEMPEYASTSGVSRKYSAANDGNQAGDPMKGMALVLEVVDHPSPPLRLPLGKDVIGRIRAKHERLLNELDAWESKAAATDFAD